jgi:hypothetical protein
VARPGETAEAFAARCLARRRRPRADAEIAKLKDTYETRFKRMREQLRTAEDRADVLKEERDGKRNEEVLSTVGSVLGGIFGGRGEAGCSARSTSAVRRVGGAAARPPASGSTRPRTRCSRSATS